MEKHLNINTNTFHWGKYKYIQIQTLFKVFQIKLLFTDNELIKKRLVFSSLFLLTHILENITYISSHTIKSHYIDR